MCDCINHGWHEGHNGLLTCNECDSYLEDSDANLMAKELLELRKKVEELTNKPPKSTIGNLIKKLKQGKHDPIYNVRDLKKVINCIPENIRIEGDWDGEPAIPMIVGTSKGYKFEIRSDL